MLPSPLGEQEKDRETPQQGQPDIARDKDETVTADAAAKFKQEDEQDLDDLVHNRARKETKKDELKPENR